MTTRPRGSLPNWKPKSPRQKGVLADLVARFEQHYREGTLPRGPRGIFYDLRPDGLGNGITYRKPDSAHPVADFDKDTEAHPAAVQEVLALARRAGITPEAWVADTRAPDALAGLYYRSGGEYVDLAERIIRSYMDGEDFALDPQRDQPIYIEVLCEAEDLMERVDRVASERGVPVYSGAGFDGIKGKRSIAERAVAREMPTVVLHIGDLDTHGGYIFNAAAEDAIAWAGDDEVLRFERIALTTEQAEAHGLLDADGKAEVDGLPVSVMDAVLRGAVEAHQEPVCREAVREEEEAERAGLADAIRERLAEEKLG